MEEKRTERAKPLYRGTQVVWYLVWLLEVLLAFRFFLKLIGANPQAGFTDFIYRITYPFALPFLNVVKTAAIQRVIFEWNTLLAMAVYGLLAWAIVKFLVIGKPVSKEEADVKLSNQDKM